MEEPRRLSEVCLTVLMEEDTQYSAVHCPGVGLLCDTLIPFGMRLVRFPGRSNYTSRVTESWKCVVVGCVCVCVCVCRLQK